VLHWGIALFSAETWTLRAVDQKHLAKAVFIKKKALFTSTLGLELRKKLLKCYIGA